MAANNSSIQKIDEEIEKKEEELRLLRLKKKEEEVSKIKQVIGSLNPKELLTYLIDNHISIFNDIGIKRVLRPIVIKGEEVTEEEAKYKYDDGKGTVIFFKDGEARRGKKLATYHPTQKDPNDHSKFAILKASDFVNGQIDEQIRDGKVDFISLVNQ